MKEEEKLKKDFKAEVKPKKKLKGLKLAINKIFKPLKRLIDDEYAEEMRKRDDDEKKSASIQIGHISISAEKTPLKDVEACMNRYLGKFKTQIPSYIG